MYDIIVQSNHTKIGAWVNSKMSERNSPLYCTITFVECRSYDSNNRFIHVGVNISSYALLIGGWSSYPPCVG